MWKGLSKARGFSKWEILGHFYTLEYPIALKVLRNMGSVFQKESKWYSNIYTVVLYLGENRKK